MKHSFIFKQLPIDSLLFCLECVPMNQHIMRKEIGADVMVFGKYYKHVRINLYLTVLSFLLNSRHY